MNSRDSAVAVAIVLLWSVKFSVNKTAVAELPPALMVALRFAMIGMLLAPFPPVPRAPRPAAGGGDGRRLIAGRAPAVQR